MWHALLYGAGQTGPLYTLTMVRSSSKSGRRVALRPHSAIRRLRPPARAAARPAKGPTFSYSPAALSFPCMFIRRFLSPGIHPQWLHFFGTGDIERAVERVRALGGVALPIERTPSGALAAPCDDPQGASFALLQRLSPLGSCSANQYFLTSATACESLCSGEVFLLCESSTYSRYDCINPGPAFFAVAGNRCG